MTAQPATDARNPTIVVLTDPSPFTTKKNFMDVKLLEKRNAIAHGEYRRVDLAEFEELHLGVVEIIDRFGDVLVAAASRRDYCSKGPVI